jgi:hypothetical protein
MLLFFFPEQSTRINLGGASNIRTDVYDSDEEHSKKKRQRLRGQSKQNTSAEVNSYLQHLQQVNPASVNIDEQEDMTEINEFVRSL